jgi:hypothetical protein
VNDVVFGLLAIAAGALFCFRGHLAFRLVIPIWGAFVGFGVGAGLVASIGGDAFLQTAVAWIVGAAVAAVFALLAYTFYEVAVAVAMGSIGFSLGASLMMALDVSWTWLIVLAGVALGVLLAAAAIAADLPMILLSVLSALAGASAITTGAMLLTGTLDTRHFSDESVTTRAGDPGWYVLYAVLAVAGIVVQARSARRLRESMRESWGSRRETAR